MCSLTPNGEPDNNSLHGSCPTTAGEKWSATKWIHVGPFGGTSEAQRAKWCALMGRALHAGCKCPGSPLSAFSLHRHRSCASATSTSLMETLCRLQDERVGTNP